MKRWVFRIFDWVMLVLTVLIVLVAILFSLARIFIPHLANYQTRIQNWASEALQEPVKIGQMTAVWRGIGPELEFRQVEILNKSATQPIIKVNKLIVGIDILDSLFKWRFEPGWIVVDGANVVVRQDQNNNLMINGYQPQPSLQSQNNAKAFLEWLLDQDKIYIENINLTWIDKNGNIVPFKHIKLKFTQGLITNELLASALVDNPPKPTPVRLVLKFGGDLLTRSFAIKFYANVKNFPLAFWLAKRIPNIVINSGESNFELWGEWNQNQLQNVQTKYEVKNLNFTSSYFIQPISVIESTGDIIWQRTVQGWNLAGDKIQIRLPEQNWSNLSWSLENVLANNSIPAQQTFKINDLTLEKTKNLLKTTTFLSSRNLSRLQTLNPTGQLKNITLIHQGNDWNNNSFSLNAEFDQINWNALQNIPGVRNLKGSINFTPQQGTLVLNTNNAFLYFNKLFRSPLPIDTLQGTVNWQNDINGLTIKSSSLTTENNFLNIKSNFSLIFPTLQQSPIINLVGGFNVTDPVTAIHYLPVGIMPKGAVRWLDEAIVAGQAMSGDVILSGPLQHFPFDNKEGKFIVDSQVRDLTLHYHDQWPDILHINGELIFDGSSMTVNANSGQIFNAKLGKTQATIEDLRKPVLTVDGTATGDLNDGLMFLEKSPLQNTIGKHLSRFIMHGPMGLNLKLRIPFTKEPNEINGTVAIQNGNLTIPQWWNLQLQNIQGTLNFTRNSLAGLLHTQWFGKPLQINVSTLNPGTPESVTQFDLGAGKITLQELSHRFHLPSSQYVSGVLNYKALLQFSDKVKAANQVLIQTDLDGININLPSPLGKTAAEKIASQIHIYFADTNKINILINYGKRLSAALTFNKSAENQINLFGGMVTFGGRGAFFTSKPGLIINGYLPVFVLSDWQSLFKQPHTEKPMSGPSSFLKSLDMTFGQFSAFGFTLSQIEIQLQSAANGWEVGLDNPDINGKILVPYEYPKGVVVGDFERLYIHPEKQVTTSSINPSVIPAINITCQNCRYGNKNFGQVRLVAAPENNKTLLFNNINVRSGSLNLNMQGKWQMQNGSSYTQLQGRLVTENLGDVLRDWDVTQSLQDGAGNVRFFLNWQGPPFKPSLNTLSGNISLQFEDGRIVNLSSSTETELGLGTILNLFSLQSIPRRLRLDFSDLTDAGFSFDVMSGNFDLRQGNAYTNNTYLDGPVAKVVINGRIGLAVKDYNLNLQVTPYVASSIPAVAATVAGGPIVGALTWVASKVLSTAVSAITTYSYQVSGSWENPNITKTNGSH